MQVRVTSLILKCRGWSTTKSVGCQYKDVEKYSKECKNFFMKYESGLLAAERF